MWSRVAAWARASVTTVHVPLNQPFSRQLTADVDPAQAPYVEWSQVSGLPAWASLSATGLLTGPALAAQESWTVSYAVRTTNPPSPYSYGSFVLAAASPKPIVSSGGQSTCEVRADTTLWCWGNAAYGQVGDGQTKDRIVPQVVGTPGWGSVSTSGATTCGVRLDQTLWCWGMNHRGQLGIGDTPRQLAPVQVAPGDALDPGRRPVGSTPCAIDADGSLWCWGDNTRGQVGVGDPRPATRRPGVGTSRWTSVTVGGYYACATRPTGRPLLGPQRLRPARHRVPTQPQAPAAVAGGVAWQRLDAGWTTTCGVTTSGRPTAGD